MFCLAQSFGMEGGKGDVKTGVVDQVCESTSVSSGSRPNMNELFSA